MKSSFSHFYDKSEHNEIFYLSELLSVTCLGVRVQNLNKDHFLF